MKLIINLIAVVASIANLIACEKSFIGERIEKITNLEGAGNWNEALIIYKELQKLSPLSMTRKLMYRKGVCEIQCSEFHAAEESFSWVIDGVELETAHDVQRWYIISSMFNLAYVQALVGKLNESKISLSAANKNFDKLKDFKNDPSWILWKSKTNDRINSAISLLEMHEQRTGKPHPPVGNGEPKDNSRSAPRHPPEGPTPAEPHSAPR